MQQHQIPQGRNAMLARHLFAEANKLPYLVAKIRQYFKVMLGQRPVIMYRHEVYPSITVLGAYRLIPTQSALEARGMRRVSESGTTAGWI